MQSNLNFTRTKYDQQLFNIDVHQSTAPLLWRLDPIYPERTLKCRSDNIGWQNQKQGVSYDASKPLVDQESDLFNISRPLTRDPNYKFIPKICTRQEQNKTGLPCSDEHRMNMYHFPSCTAKQEYTRLSNTPSTLKEVPIPRFDIVCLNPQDESRWLIQGNVGVSTRLVAKDNHVPCVSCNRM